MTPLEHLQKRLEDNNALIVQFENALSLPENKEYRGSLAANIKSLHNVQERLEEQFLELAALQEQEVYRYRIIDTGEAPTLGGIADAWAHFQKLFAVVYSKLTKREMPAVLGYSYCFSSSVGVVVTLPKLPQTVLLAGNPVDDTSEIVFDLIESKRITEIAKMLGPEAIEAANDWLSVHLQHHYGLGLEWKSKRITKRITTIPYEQLSTLQTTIADTTTETTLVLDGELDTVGYEAKIFKFKSDDGEIFEGTFESAITPEHAASIPKRYKAKILKTTRVVKKQKKDKPVTYLLTSLEPLT